MESACDCGNERSCYFCSLWQRSSMDPLMVYSRRRFRIDPAVDGVAWTTSMSLSNSENPAATLGSPASSSEASIGVARSDPLMSDSEEQEGDIVVQPSEEDVPANLSTRNADSAVVRSTGNAPAGSLLVLTNPGVLKCLICDLPLNLPVFQRWNGHMAGESCCLNWKNRCFCGLNTGYNHCLAMENVIEAIKSSCRFIDYCCSATFTYTERRVHESNCIFEPFCCPNNACEYISKCEELYRHFYSQHHPMEFVFNSTFSINLPRDEYITFFQERDEKTLFILESKAFLGGTFVVLYGVAPASMKGVFRFEICTAWGSVIARDIVRVFRGKLPQTFAMLLPSFIPKEFRTEVLDLRITIYKEQGLLGPGSSGRS